MTTLLRRLWWSDASLWAAITIVIVAYACAAIALFLAFAHAVFLTIQLIYTHGPRWWVWLAIVVVVSIATGRAMVDDAKPKAGETP